MGGQWTYVYKGERWVQGHTWFHLLDKKDPLIWVKLKEPDTSSRGNVASWPVLLSDFTNRVKLFLYALCYQYFPAPTAGFVPQWKTHDYKGLTQLYLILCLVLGHIWLCSGVTPDSTCLDYSWWCSGMLYGMPEIELKWAACKASTIPAVLTFQPKIPDSSLKTIPTSPSGKGSLQLFPRSELSQVGNKMLDWSYSILLPLPYGIWAFQAFFLSCLLP